MKKFILKIIKSFLSFIIWNMHFKLLNVEENREFEKIKLEYNQKKLKLAKHFYQTTNDLTIIIPVYNCEKLLKNCIESLIKQKTTYNYNMIFINDGSTDGSLNILNEYVKKHDNISIINQKNRGISEARNSGLKKITGKYVAFVDSDDYVDEKYVDVLLRNAYEKDADIVRCNYYEYNIENKNIIKTGLQGQNKFFENGLESEILNYKGYPWGGIFKSSLFENIEFPEKYWYEDMIIRMILFRKAKSFIYINEPLYYYCIHSNNISKKIEKTKDIRCLDHFFLVGELCELSEKLNINNDLSLASCILYEYTVVLWLRTRGLNKILRKQVFNKACDILKRKVRYELLNSEQKIVFDIMYRKDYLRWKLYAINKMISVKYGII